MIKTIDMEYNAGGTYIYYGQLNNGNYYITDTTDTIIIDANPKNLEDALTSEWLEQHFIEWFEDDTFFKKGD